VGGVRGRLNKEERRRRQAALFIWDGGDGAAEFIKQREHLCPKSAKKQRLRWRPISGGRGGNLDQHVGNGGAAVGTGRQREGGEKCLDSETECKGAVGPDLRTRMRSASK